MRLPKILLIEDSVDVKDLVLVGLKSVYPISVATTKAEAMKMVGEEEFDLIILDVELSDGDGFQMCAELKAKGWHSKPIIFLTAKASVEDKIVGFAVGADDYMVKPFDHRELLARIQAKLRSAENFRRGKRIGDLLIDFERQAAFSCQGDQEIRIELTTTEFKLLTFFVQNPEAVLNRDKIMDFVWGPSHFLGDRSVDVHVSSLRRKMQGMQCGIKTIYKVGYVFSSSNT